MSGSSGTVVFDYDIWAAQFPELAAQVSNAQAQMYFDQATLFVDNTACSPIWDTTKRAVILNMTTAHIAQLLAPLNGTPSNGLVGRVSNASEGSVSVGTDLRTPNTAAWWQQTKYGLLAWQAMAPYRNAMYVPAPQIPLNQQSYPFYIGGLVFP